MKRTIFTLAVLASMAVTNIWAVSPKAVSYIYANYGTMGGDIELFMVEHNLNWDDLNKDENNEAIFKDPKVDSNFQKFMNGEDAETTNEEVLSKHDVVTEYKPKNTKEIWFPINGADFNPKVSSFYVFQEGIKYVDALLQFRKKQLLKNEIIPTAKQNGFDINADDVVDAHAQVCEDKQGKFGCYVLQVVAE